MCSSRSKTAKHPFMRRAPRNTLLRRLAFLAFLSCVAVWSWSYVRPLGVSRIGQTADIVESERGSVILGRLVLGDQSFLSPFPQGWSTFSSFGNLSDLGTLAEAWLDHRGALGFAGGIGKAAELANKIWVLD